MASQGRDAGSTRELDATLFGLRPVEGVAAHGDLHVGVHPNEERTIERRHLARTIVDSALDCIIVMDHLGKIVEFNLAAEEAFGYTRREALRRRVSDLMPTEIAPVHRRGLARYMSTGKARVLDRRFETTARRADGSLFPIELTVTRVPDREPPLFVAFLRDLTDCKLTQEALRDSELRLRRAGAERLRLLRKLVAAHEDERSRIAAAIHDDSIQAVAALGIRISAMRRQATDDGLRASLLDVEENVLEAVSRLRRLMFELHPTTLDRDGLAATLETHLAQFDDKPSYRLENELAREPPPRVRLALYRIIQEAITNSRKHARPRNVVVELRDGPGEFVARIHDDGSGFRVDRIESPAGHLGLSTMREQAETANGRLLIESRPGKGTTVEARIPAVCDPEQ